MRPSIGGKLHVHLGVPLLERLRERATKQGVSISEVMRGALAAFLDYRDHNTQQEDNQ